MPIRKLPKTFDEHLGSVVDGMAKAKGGRAWLATIARWSPGTVERRVTGRAEFTVKEMELVAEALKTTTATIVSQALRNYADGTEQGGIEKLLREEGPVSEAPVSLDARRSKSIAEMSDEELEGLRSVANKDKGIGHDESDPA